MVNCQIHDTRYVASYRMQEVTIRKQKAKEDSSIGSALLTFEL